MSGIANPWVWWWVGLLIVAALAQRLLGRVAGCAVSLLLLLVGCAPYYMAVGR